MRVLVTGSSGRLGRRMVLRLYRQHEVVCIDERPWPGLPAEITHFRVDLRRRAAADVFRRHQPEAVLHLGVVHDVRVASEELYARNVLGTETLLRLCSEHAVRKLVLLSSGDIYGPMPSNSHFLDEDAPLMAGQGFPDLRTLVAVDRTVQSFFWRHNETETVILRPCHIVGAHVQNAASKYLRLRVVPTLMGFDPMLQLIHEDDALAALSAALGQGVRGVFNVAGVEPVPLSTILKILGKPVLPLPYTLLRLFLDRAWKYRLTSFPAPELEHLRFNAVLDTRRAVEVLGIRPDRDLATVLASFRVEPRAQETC